MKWTLALAATTILLLSGCGSASSDSALPAPTATSTILDYTKDGQDDVTVKTSSDVSRLVGAPADFRAYIAKELARRQVVKDDSCPAKPQIKVMKVDPAGWASGGSFTPQCGGYPTLWARVGGSWKNVWGGQQLPDCVTLKKYAFPASIVGTQCGTTSGQTVKYPS